MGGFSLDWSYVRNDIAEHARTCVYDRAGYGWSESVESPQTSEDIARDLHELLKGGGESGPYLLIGHSAGGFYVRAFAQQSPNEVAGMVLLDSSHENQGLVLTSLKPLEDQQLSQLNTCSLLSPTGLMRVFRVHDSTVPDDVPLTEEEVEAWLGHLYQTAFCSTVAREFEVLQRETREDHPPLPIGDIPLVVLTRDVMQDEVPEGLGIDAAVFQEAGQAGLELQQELAQLSTDGRHQIAAESGHYIHWDQPGIVVDVIVEMVSVFRSSVGQSAADANRP